MKVSAELISKAKEILGTKAAEIIAKDLKIGDWNEEKLCGKSIFKEENTGSMIWNKKANSFHCFSTGKNYDIIQHYTTFGKMTFVDAVKKLVSDTELIVDPAELDSLYSCREKDDYFNVNTYKFPKDENMNDRAVVESYMSKRLISPETLDYCDVKQDDSGNIAFQFIDIVGRHVATKYRVSRSAKNGEFKWWWQKNADTCPLLYGINKVDISKPLVIVEGLVDRLSIVEAGFPNVVSIDGGAADLKWIDFNWEVLDKVETIILFADDDVPGKKMMKDAASRIGEAKCRFVKAPTEVKTAIGDYYKKFSHDINKVDANNVLVACGRDVLLQMINGAEEIPNKKLKLLMSVEQVDIKNIERMSTGYKNLDNILYGSLMGCFTILSGVAGGGKSTIANQLCVLSPLEQGYKTFIYSGELSEGQLKNWIVKPFAGVSHALRWQSPNMPAGFTPTEEASKAISKYYMDDIILYVGDDEDGLSASNEDILSQMEYAYKRHGCKVFFIDNLMTVSFSDDDDDKWKSQKDFIKKLLRFTNKYNVNTTLVAHPKKPARGEEPGVYSIHGASELVNLCHRLIWVNMLTEDPQGYNSEIIIIKDRPTGRTGKSCKLFYDSRTMRLYGDEKEQYREYSWVSRSNVKYSKATEAQLAINYVEKSEEVLGPKQS